MGYAITTLPEGFTPHRQIAKVYEARRAMVESGEGIDWGMAEALAFGTLLAEGEWGGCGDSFERDWELSIAGWLAQMQAQAAPAAPAPAFPPLNHTPAKRLLLPSTPASIAAPHITTLQATTCG